MIRFENSNKILLNELLTCSKIWIQQLICTTCRYGADGSERRKVIKHAFRVIFDNIIPDVHKVFIYHNKRKKQISKDEYTVRMKKLKSTKKAAYELNDQDKLFYEFLVSIGLNKDQKREFKERCEELDVISEQYHQ